MNQVFIVRPFGTKNGIDFNRVEAELIQPAIKAVGLSGGTTGEIIKQGNIRTDMFQKLLVADLVIADISIYNPNAYYQLGVRHAFREKRTFLIRCSRQGLPPDAELDDMPFDLKTDRYREYRLDDLAGSLKDLIEALRATVTSEDQDSPIFQLLPKLEEQHHEVFLSVPRDFREDVEQAEKAVRAGDLSMLAEETAGFEWRIAGLRLLGKSLFEIAHWERSRAVWELVRDIKPLDPEANLKLGTIYHRLNDLSRSDLALRRALDHPKLDQECGAEAHALLGRNAKQRWQEGWKDAAHPRTEALRSPFLQEAYREYLHGFEEDQNAFFPGLNALAMLAVLIELAEALPQIWEERFAGPADAEAELARLRQKRLALAGAVEVSLQAAASRASRKRKPDLWIDVSMADLHCLTRARPAFVASAYRNALANLGAFKLGAARRQLELYRQLGLFSANVEAALTLPNWGEPAAAPVVGKPRHVILFTGHRVDAPGREKPRFPADKEATARKRIKELLAERLELLEGGPCGIAGGASGGDILFHEVCTELGIPTELYLALPADSFAEVSVKDAGGDWEKRFFDLTRRIPTRILAEKEKLPVWLSDKRDYDFWKRNNLWMLHNAIAMAGKDLNLRDDAASLGKNLTLIALWNGEGGDGPGGTQDMVAEVEKLGAHTIIIDTKREFGL